MKEIKLIKPIYENGLYGFVDINGRRIKKNIFKSAGDFKEGLSVVVSYKKTRLSKEVNWVYGFMSNKGDLVQFIGLDNLRNFSGGLAPFKRDGKWGFMNTNFEVVIPNKYQEVGNFSDGLASFKENKKWGYINTLGNAVIPAIYSFTTEFREGIALVEKGRTNQLIDKDGEEIFRTEGLIIPPFSQELIAVSSEQPDRNRKWGYVNTNGELTIDYMFDKVKPFSEGLAPVCIDDKWGYIDNIGNIVIEPQYLHACCFSEGLGRIIETKYNKDNDMTISASGFINYQGELVIPTIYGLSNDFVNGYANVRDIYNNEFIIDKNNNILSNEEKFVSIDEYLNLI